MKIVKRLERVEKSIGPGWVIEVMALVNVGKLTAGDVLDGFGLVALERFPQWYRDMPDDEKEARAAAADKYIQAILAPYSDAEIEDMIAGKMPFPEGV